ncbi:Pkinase-domain-containing protein [Myriangium duriaei CBS 260.36]|uniref:non-specific serine/threonine protein kinase n=1 Tax=Myriangium duriaei CBS 260.36 TaxID=1168546 RepID=A0A9P4J3Z8_9PEZI|nr:Pkinase-domain-containing protein [Myriangium duriaei CBS 260.36]
MSSALDDEDLSLSITPSNPRRSSDDRRDAAAMPPPRAPASRNHGQPPSTMSKRLGQYDIVRTLGEGSFGKVKLATHKVSGQKVALKIISRSKLVTRDMAGRIEREIQYLQLLRHPHIIKLFTVITTPREIVMVLEYAGGELFEYIVNHGRLPEDKARKFFQQIVCAVEYCHRHKIVHRDLKPENLLLDDSFNVKIADFGLSNIMTDGNFLKTSCGSPNYAAPEVISGKLYAGPEVDVWSCGVILYVLLTGRLPFDDEYIPSLFKKIQQGTYTVPAYLPKDAARLIKRMLQVNPVARISIQEIRQDPWFTKHLEEYLQPNSDDMTDTGLDPNKPIDPRKLGPKQPAVVQEHIHSLVVGKLGKTMGYAKDDVQEALSKDEPSAIKDAYLIVRENTIMKENLPELQPFLAQSPPVGTPGFASFSERLPQTQKQVRPQTQTPSISTPTSEVDHPRSGSTASSTILDARSPISTIGVLPSSLPDYHKAFMKGQSPKSNVLPDDDLNGSESGTAPTSEQKAATARRLNPHAKGSHSNLSKVEKPEGMTPIPSKDAKKHKQAKWQFGIRSRNSPSEAMLAIYRVLKNMGAVWEIPRIRRPGGGEGSPSHDDGDNRHNRRRGHEGSQSPEYSDSDPDAGTDPEYATKEERDRRRARRGHGSAGSSDDDGFDDDADARRRNHRRRHNPRGRDRFGPWNDWGYSLPEDPWIINARFRKEGMYPPGVAHPSSTHSSRVDLSASDSEAVRRRSSTMSSSASIADSTPPLGSTHGSSENIAATGPPGIASRSGSSTSLSKRGSNARPDQSCWVYVTIQLYCIEKDSYMVDFKCAGYERLMRKFRRGLRKATSANDETTGKSDGSEDLSAPEDSEPEDKDTDEDDMDEGYVGLGRVVGEKDINSPFPFMDVASSLIVNLAQRD